MNEKNQTKLVHLLATIYSNSPKDHNPKGFIDEFLSRVRASVNVNSIRAFYSKLMRKLSCTDIFNENYGEWIVGLSQKEEYEILQELRDNSHYYILLAKEYLRMKWEAKENKK